MHPIYFNRMSVEYYRKRAAEYENIYAKAERAKDITQVKKALIDCFSGKKVLDIGCGTGYWTYWISQSATEIHATDINETVLEIAKKKKYACPVTWGKEDYYELKSPAVPWDALLCSFVISHIPKNKLEEFWKGIRKMLLPGSICVFVDNLYIKGNSTPIAKTDSEGNSWQQRKLENGESFEVLKNYPSVEELKLLFHLEDEIEYQKFEYYWMLKCKRAS